MPAGGRGGRGRRRARRRARDGRRTRPPPRHPSAAGEQLAVRAGGLRHHRAQQLLAGSEERGDALGERGREHQRFTWRATLEFSQLRTEVSEASVVARSNCVSGLLPQSIVSRSPSAAKIVSAPAPAL